MTALHLAIGRRKINIISLLLLHKADYTLKNKLDNDSLQMAALRVYSDIVETILEISKLPVSGAIRAYELLGTTFFNE